MCVPASMSLCTPCACRQIWKPEEVIGYRETGVMRGCELLNTSPPEVL